MAMAREQNIYWEVDIYSVLKLMKNKTINLDHKSRVNEQVRCFNYLELEITSIDFRNLGGISNM